MMKRVGFEGTDGESKNAVLKMKQKKFGRRKVGGEKEGFTFQRNNCYHATRFG